MRGDGDGGRLGGCRCQQPVWTTGPVCNTLSIEKICNYLKVCFPATKKHQTKIAGRSNSTEWVQPAAVKSQPVCTGARNIK